MLRDVEASVAETGRSWFVPCFMGSVVHLFVDYLPLLDVLRYTSALFVNSHGLGF